MVLLYLLAHEVGVSSQQGKFIALAITVACLFSIESLYSQGIIYWGQSLFQAILLAQLIIVYYIFKHRRLSFGASSLLAILSIIAPFTEWTGLISNLGIIIFATVRYYQTRNKYSLQVMSNVAIATIVGILLFVIPMIYSLGLNDFIYALKIRFLARAAGSTELPTTWIQLMQGYIESFGPLILTTATLITVAVFRSASRQKFVAALKHVYGYLLIIFALLEKYNHETACNGIFA